VPINGSPKREIQKLIKLIKNCSKPKTPIE